MENGDIRDINDELYYCLIEYNLCYYFLRVVYEIINVIVCLYLKSFDIPIFTIQVQGDKEKLLYEIDEIQAQLEKAQLNTNRFQAEKEDFQLDAERHRSTNDKLQVSEYLEDIQYSNVSRLLDLSYLYVDYK